MVQTLLSHASNQIGFVAASPFAVCGVCVSCCIYLGDTEGHFCGNPLEFQALWLFHPAFARSFSEHWLVVQAGCVLLPDYPPLDSRALAGLSCQGHLLCEPRLHGFAKNHLMWRVLGELPSFMREAITSTMSTNRNGTEMDWRYPETKQIAKGDDAALQTDMGDDTT